MTYGTNFEYVFMNSNDPFIDDIDPIMSFKAVFQFKNNKVTLSDLQQSKAINPFIVVNGLENLRKEVHLPYYPATPLAEPRYFSQYNDDGSGNYVTAATTNVVADLPFAIDIPVAWDPPLENINITTAYPDLLSWVSTGSPTNWYNNKVSGKSKETKATYVTLLQTRYPDMF